MLLASFVLEIRVNLVVRRAKAGLRKAYIDADPESLRLCAGPHRQPETLRVTTWAGLREALREGLGVR
jgi:hypothetical protein